MNYNSDKNITKLTEVIKVLAVLDIDIYIGFKCVFGN